MPSPKYPLQSLLQHRAREVDDATADLGVAVRAREAADRARARAEASRLEAEERAAKVRTEEAGRLARGELRALDLTRGEAWEVGARAELHELAQAERAAEDKLLGAREHEVGARVDLAQKMSDRDVVVKDEARFRARVTARVLASEEEAAEEAFRGVRRT